MASVHNHAPNKFTDACRKIVRLHVEDNCSMAKSADILVAILLVAVMWSLLGLIIADLIVFILQSLDNAMYWVLPSLVDFQYLPTASTILGCVSAAYNILSWFILQVTLVILGFVIYLEYFDKCPCGCDLTELDELLARIRFCENYPCAFSVRDWLLRLVEDVKAEMASGTPRETGYQHESALVIYPEEAHKEEIHEEEIHEEEIHEEEIHEEEIHEEVAHEEGGLVSRKTDGWDGEIMEDFCDGVETAFLD